MSKYCGKSATIKSIFHDSYKLDIDNQTFY